MKGDWDLLPTHQTLSAGAKASATVIDAIPPAAASSTAEAPTAAAAAAPPAGKILWHCVY
jgi:hypothetical protein